MISLDHSGTKAISYDYSRRGVTVGGGGGSYNYNQIETEFMRLKLEEPTLLTVLGELLSALSMTTVVSFLEKF